MATEEVPDKVRKADAARYRAHSKLESTEREIREWMLDDPGTKVNCNGAKFPPCNHSEADTQPRGAELPLPAASGDAGEVEVV